VYCEIQSVQQREARLNEHKIQCNTTPTSQDRQGTTNIRLVTKVEMAKHTYNCSTEELNEDVVGFMAGERGSRLPCHSPESMSGLDEEVQCTTINVARFNVGGVMKET
jgi:hypothetical protein